MKVKLIAYTPNPEHVVYSAARNCYSRAPPTKVFDKGVSENEINLVRKIIKTGHTSVIEHVNFTFMIMGISRVTSHQLVRHRIASYSQQSQRYVKYTDDVFVIPPLINENEESKKVFESSIKEILKIYQKLMKLGIPKEDARYILPNAAKTNIIVTMNARSLWNFFNLRCCLKSQWEIRELAWKMLALVKQVAPSIFSNAGPWCYDGVCPENDKKCRLYPKNTKTG